MFDVKGKKFRIIIPNRLTWKSIALRLGKVAVRFPVESLLSGEFYFYIQAGYHFSRLQIIANKLKNLEGEISPRRMYPVNLALHVCTFIIRRLPRRQFVRQRLIVFFCIFNLFSSWPSCWKIDNVSWCTLSKSLFQTSQIDVCTVITFNCKYSMYRFSRQINVK